MRKSDMVVAVVIALICTWVGLEIATRYLEWRPIVGNSSWGGTLDGRAFRELLGEGLLVISGFFAIIAASLILLMRSGARGAVLMFPWIAIVAFPMVLMAFLPMGILMVMHFWPFLMASTIAGLLFWASVLLLFKRAG